MDYRYTSNTISQMVQDYGVQDVIISLQIYNATTKNAISKLVSIGQRGDAVLFAPRRFSHSHFGRQAVQQTLSGLEKWLPEQPTWVEVMNHFRTTAEEVVLREMIDAIP